MNKMKYNDGGSVNSTDDVSAEKIKFLLQQEKDAQMDKDMQRGMENYKKNKAGKPTKPKPKPVETENKNMGGMVGYKKGGKVRGCGIATQGVRKAQGSY